MPDDKITDKSLSFVSDWQKRNKKQQNKHRILLSAALLFVLIICIFLLIWYRKATYDRIVNLNQRYIQDSALQETTKVEKDLDDTKELIRKYADQYVLLMDKLPNSDIEERLSILCDNTIFDRIGFITPEGIDISVQGTCDVSDRDYFYRGMNGEKGYDLLESSRLTGRPTFAFYAPVKKKDGTIIGVMTGFHERERMDELLSYQFLNLEPNTYLLKRDGTVVGSSRDEMINDNMLEKLAQKKFSGKVDYHEIVEAIDDHERTSITFSFVDGKETSVGVISQFNGSGWMILSVLPHNVTSTMIGKANDTGTVLIIITAIVFIMLIVMFISFMLSQDSRLDTEMTLATDSLRKATKHDQRQTFIIESLGNTYSSVYFIDLTTGKYERIHETEPSVMAVPEKGIWEFAYPNYVESYVDEKYRDGMLRLGNMRTLEENLSEDEKLSLEYQRSDSNWRKAVMLPAERSKAGDVISAIFAVQKIESEKKRELETQLALKEAFEAAQLASKAKTTFLSNISHDIRTPMNAIVGMTAIAAANINNTEKVSDCLKKIASSSKHLLGLINEVLDMSKIESGKVDLNEAKFSLSDLIDELITMNQPLIKEKGHTLTVKVNNLTHENVIGDSTRLQQVFTNLLTNAIKYTPAGGKLEIIVSEMNTNKNTIGWYEIKFKDNGIGMTEEFRKYIFDPFSRADDTRLEKIQGTGLGMPIARNIIRMMNGDITVESEINKGSTFTVSFALKLQNEEEVNYDKFVGLPILVVDDDINACESTCTILDSLSMKSEWVDSGQKAVDKAEEHHKNGDDYYAIIVDWKMPEMNGIETAKEIRKRVGNDLPIIVISAYDWSDIETEARSAGVNGFLSKPLFKSRIIDLFSEFTGSPKSNEIVSGEKQMKEQDFTGKSILLVEDNELNREIAVEILSIMGLEIETAENGQIAVDMLTSSDRGYYDLIFMDIQMPVMNGYDATKNIRASSHPDAKRIPIIAMTANAFSTDVRQAFDAGMNGHVSKPIDINNVVNALKENLK